MNTANHLKAGEIIPIKKEFSFIFKISAIMIASAAVALAILYLFLDKEVGTSYRGAFQVLSSALGELNYYIVIAIIVQFIFSSIVVYFVSLYFSHKIAGPMYRLKAVLQQYMEGQQIEKVSFRRTDFIPGVSEIFTRFFSFLGHRKQLLSDAETLLAQIQQAPAGSSQQREGLQKLQTIIRELEG